MVRTLVFERVVGRCWEMVCESGGMYGDKGWIFGEFGGQLRCGRSRRLSDAAVGDDGCT